MTPGSRWGRRLWRSPWRAAASRCPPPAARAAAPYTRVRLALAPAHSKPMLGTCCTLLHTDGLLRVAQQCCIRWALLHACARETCLTHHPVVGNTSTNAQLGCRSLRHTVSGAASVRLLCCFCVANDWGVCMLQTVLQHLANIAPNTSITLLPDAASLAHKWMTIAN